MKKIKKVVSNGKFWAAIFAIVAIGAPKAGKDLLGVSDQIAYVASGICTVIATVTAAMSEKPGKKKDV